MRRGYPLARGSGKECNWCRHLALLASAVPMKSAPGVADLRRQRPSEGRHSVAQRRLRPFICSQKRGTVRTMALPRKSHDHVSTNKLTSSVNDDKNTGGDPIAPSAFGLTKVAYAVNETLDLLSIGRTALYAAVKRGDLKRVKFGKKTLFYAADLAVFLARLRAPERSR